MQPFSCNRHSVIFIHLSLLPCSTGLTLLAEGQNSFTRWFVCEGPLPIPRASEARHLRRLRHMAALSSASAAASSSSSSSLSSATATASGDDESTFAASSVSDASAASLSSIDQDLLARAAAAASSSPPDNASVSVTASEGGEREVATAERPGGREDGAGAPAPRERFIFLRGVKWGSVDSAQVWRRLLQFMPVELEAPLTSPPGAVTVHAGVYQSE
jgi:hypothetical protein